MTKYTQVRLLSHGGYGDVHLVRHSVTGELRVMKQISRRRCARDGLGDPETEAVLLQQLASHPNILRLHEWYGDTDHVYLITEYAAGGDLHDFIKARRLQGTPLAEHKVLDLFVQLCLALRAVHGKHLLHRDVKSKNIFLSASHRVVQLGDFGAGKALTATTTFADTSIGTPYYLSPEICTGHRYSYATDVWSLGVVLYELLTYARPFTGTNLSELVHAIARQPPPPISSAAYSSDLTQLVAHMLSKQPQRRPTVRAILSLPFVKRHMKTMLKQHAGHTRRSISLYSTLEDIRAQLERRLGLDLLVQLYTSAQQGTLETSLQQDCNRMHKRVMQLMTSRQWQECRHLLQELDNIGSFHYAPVHPMKPFRIRMTDSLVKTYGLYQKMKVVRPTPATFLQMAKFHTDDYLNFLQTLTVDVPVSDKRCTFAFFLIGTNFNFNDDCPVFEGIYEFSALSAGGSIEGANRLLQGDCDIAVNWGGGLHHAKKTEASGFCYVNDIVLAILELLKYHQRVLYIDCDVHHGDGVEEAFYTTDRVMTASFHKFGNGFFPGSGDITDIGVGKGKHYSINVPLAYGIDDQAYHQVFEPVIRHVIEWFRPGAIVLQMGADSLAGDRLGMFNLSMKGHAHCVAFVKSFNLPMLLLGGGGYTIRNVARAWTYETALAVDAVIPEELPYNDFYEYFGPEYRLDVPATNMPNLNTRKQLDNIRTSIIESLRHLPFAPSVQMQETPRDNFDAMAVDQEALDADKRLPGSVTDNHLQKDAEFSDSEDEEGGGRRREQSWLDSDPRDTYSQVREPFRKVVAEEQKNATVQAAS
ncbi:hypothetical protein RI367_003072 [Sorochytrium milnesiophthora]